ncbi:hypothetical protein F5I97DRAFT_50054 [Phlebopus sp. FC_14]|nr:hypothetical protein F5I97DRAFT_50054 [Phlebopus sp. FC_14]
MFSSKLFGFALVLSAALATEGAVLPRVDGTLNITTSITPSTQNSTFASGTPTPSVTTSHTIATTNVTSTNITLTSTTSTPIPRPTTNTTVTARAVSCDGIQNWQTNLAYTAGDKVIFNGHLFTATQWSYNSQPGTSGAWTDNGDCTQPISNKANCSGVSAWQMSQAYATGSKVTFNGHLWVAVQWTSSNTPGDTSGTWKDLGVCA